MQKDQVTILVLGAAVWPNGEPSPTLRRRTLHAARLMREGRAGRAVLCGGLGVHPPSEAQVMARLMREAGVPETALVLEETSTDTITNISNALTLCPDMGAVMVITDRFHGPRARIIARHLGLKVQRVPLPQPDVGKRRLMRAMLREGFAMLKVGIWMTTGHKLP